MAAKLQCPNSDCRADLKGWNCPNCGDIRDIVRAQGAAGWSYEVAIAAMARELGAFVDTTSGDIVLPGDTAWAPFTFTPTDRDGTFLAWLGRVVGDVAGAAGVSNQDMEIFMRKIHKQRPAGLPLVKEKGDRPRLFIGAEGQLYWPFTEDNDLCIADGLYYTGPRFTPARTGAFEEFLGTVRCQSTESEAVLRGWLLGTLLSCQHPPGQAPMLMLCAKQNGQGKSSTSTLLGSLLGGIAEVVWDHHLTPVDLNRQVMDPSVRTLVIDNIAPQGDAPIFSSSHLASFLTQRDLTVKKLFASTGLVRQANRLAVIGTANVPALSSELLARCVVCELGAGLGREMRPSWENLWRARRLDIIKDMMATILENWPKGAVECSRPFRFCDWQAAVARAMQREPVIMPRDTCVKAPIELLLEEYFAVHNTTEATVAAVVEWAEGVHTPIVRIVKQQQELKAESIEADLRLYRSRFTLQNGRVCHGSLRTN